LRGFQQSSLGPRDAVTDSALGGNRKLQAGAELLFPFPGSGKDRSLRLSAFLDSGQVWESSQRMRLSDMRASTGLALAWNSPVGPLKFSIAQPLKRDPLDRLERFQFQLGSVF
jgi:outer membrane protein insertion porin family